MSSTTSRPSIFVRDVPMFQSGPTSKSLQFDVKVLSNLPKVSVVCPTGNRGHLWPLMKHNMLKQTYPHEKIHWVIVDDGADDIELTNNVEEFKKEWKGTIEFRKLPSQNRLILGRKRNLMCEIGFETADICVHMDDDDLYSKESIKVRVTLLEMYKKDGIECVGCTQVNCYDVMTDSTFYAYDPCEANKPSSFSESSVAYYKSYWEERKWPDDARNAEGHHFMLNRWHKAMNIPSTFVICQLTHDNNTIVRRTYNHNSDDKTNFLATMTEEEKKTVEQVNAVLLSRNPTEKLAKIFLDLTSLFVDNKEKVLETYFRTSWGVEFSHRFKVFRRAHMAIDHFSHLQSRNLQGVHAGTRVAYVCPPNTNPFPWNAFEKCPNWGGSEEAVKHITKYFANNLGAHVVVFSNWSKELIQASGPISDLKKYGRIDPETGVCWKPYELWNAKDEADLTIVWRDPGGLDGFRDKSHRSGKTCLDVHDQLQVYVAASLNPVDFIMVKSEHHKMTCIPVEHHSKCIVIPNGFDPFILDDTNTRTAPQATLPDQRKYLFINTSRPDRGLTCLMDTVIHCQQPLLKAKSKSMKQKKSAWAYGFQDMPLDLVAKWNAKRNAVHALDILEKISEEDVSKLYNNGKYFLYFSRFIETDCISLTKAMYYGSFPLVTNIGAVGEKIKKYIAWLEKKGYSGTVRVPSLYTIPVDRLSPDGLGPENERHPNDSSSGLFDVDHEPCRMKAWIETEMAKPITPRDQEAMREFVMETFTWDSISDAWSNAVFDSVQDLRAERRLIQLCNDILRDLQNVSPLVQKLLTHRRIVLVNPVWSSPDEEKACKAIIVNHQKVAQIIHTTNPKSVEAYIQHKFLLSSIEGFDTPALRQVVVANGCGLIELTKRLHENKDVYIVEF